MPRENTHKSQISLRQVRTGAWLLTLPASHLNRVAMEDPEKSKISIDALEPSEKDALKTSHTPAPVTIELHS